MKKLIALFALILTVLAAPVYAAVETVHPLGFPTGVSPNAENITELYNFIFWIIAVFAILVEGLIIVCIWKFRKSKNKTPAKFSHNTLLEIVWITIPVIICVAISVKSFYGIQYLRTMPEEGMDLEVIAYQFGWDFDYPDLEVSAPEAEKVHEQLSSAGSDRYVKDVLIPIGTTVRAHVTAKDVLHAFFAPSLGVKIDAVPGRINYQWFKAEKLGDYIGQCAELCGSAHGEMYFNIKVVSKEDFLAWVNKQRAENDKEPLTMAQMEETF